MSHYVIELRPQRGAVDSRLELGWDEHGKGFFVRLSQERGLECSVLHEASGITFKELARTMRRLDYRLPPLLRRILVADQRQVPVLYEIGDPVLYSHAPDAPAASCTVLNVRAPVRGEGSILVEAEPEHPTARFMGRRRQWVFPGALVPDLARIGVR